MAKVYVSSTVLDLQAEREAVMAWLVARGHQPVHSYTPSGETVRASCLADIDGCELLVLILGHRYGAQPDGDELSITHQEFRRADKIPRIALMRTVIDEERSDVRDPARMQKVWAFRDEVAASVRTAKFADLTELVVALSTGVERALDRPGGAQDWLVVQAGALSAQFAERMPAIGEPARLYQDLVVTERSTANDRPLAELADTTTPILLTGEGGAGKSTALLHLATELAGRAQADATAPVPIYVDLSKLTMVADVPDLQRLVVDAVPVATDWAELTTLLRERRIFYLFDAFNEMPEHLQRTGATVLRRFVDKHRDRDAFLIASRTTPLLDQFAAVYEVLRLRPEQVRVFLERTGLASLYHRMPSELRDLAGNPFMLVAITRTLAGTTEADMPRNRGRLYARFVDDWMRREGERRAFDYHFERVKQPLLADLAVRMTATGVTALTIDEDVAALVETRLAAVHDATRRRGGMPADWTVDGFLAEVTEDGLLRRRGDHLLFLHQSIQEYFTALRFADDAVALAQLVPAVVTNVDGSLSDHWSVPVARMLSGIVDDATDMIAALVGPNPVLAAAALAGASQVRHAAREEWVAGWVAGVQSPDKEARWLASDCLAQLGDPGPAAFTALAALIFSAEFGDFMTASNAFRSLDERATARAVVAHVLAVPDDGLPELATWVYMALRNFPAPSLVAAAVERRRETTDPAERTRLARMLATLPRSHLTSSAQVVAQEWPDSGSATLIAEMVAEAATHEPLDEEPPRDDEWAEAEQLFAARVEQRTSELRTADAVTVAKAIKAPTADLRSAGRQVGVARGLPVADAVVEAILRGRDRWALSEPVAALVDLCGAEDAVRRLAAHTADRPRRIGVLHPDVDLEPTEGDRLPPAAVATLARLVPDAHLTRVDPTDDAFRVLRTDHEGAGWVSRYELHPTNAGMALVECTRRRLRRRSAGPDHDQLRARRAPCGGREPRPERGAGGPAPTREARRHDAGRHRDRPFPTHQRPSAGRGAARRPGASQEPADRGVGHGRARRRPGRASRTDPPSAGALPCRGRGVRGARPRAGQGHRTGRGPRRVRAVVRLVRRRPLRHA